MLHDELFSNSIKDRSVNRKKIISVCICFMAVCKKGAGFFTSLLQTYL